MNQRFVRCPHCKMPHDAGERVCPNTGLRITAEARPGTREPSRAGPESKMSELPPPSRPPEPLSFRPQHLAERPAPARPPSAPPRPTTERPAPARGDPKRSLIGQTVGERYRMNAILGEGGMGTVYDAEHLTLGRHVAIKVLSPAQAKKRVAVKRFQQEARAAGAIGHPNICEVYDLGQLDDGSPYLVMEKLVGETLAERIAKEGALPFDEVIEVIAQVLAGLIAAHEKGIVHRDIKPENIFLARRSGLPAIIKILDFGVSKMMPEFQTGEDAFDLTRTGMVMGTPYYMSPEQARGDRNLDGRVDVYACGIVMYEALAGRRPYLAPNYNALLLAIINTTPKALREHRPEIKPELEAMIMRAMAKNRAERYSSAAHFLHDLKPIPMAEPSAARPPPPGAAPSAPAAPGATLSSRMHPPMGAATRADVRVPRPIAVKITRPPETSGSIDVPIDLTGEESDDGDDATEVFRPAAHVRSTPPGPPSQPPPLPAAARKSVPPAAPRKSTPPAAPRKSVPPAAASKTAPPAASRKIALPTAARSAPPPPVALPVPAAPPAPIAAAVPAAAEIDDWDGETIVKRPDLPLADDEPAPNVASEPPFNPEETMKIDTTTDIEALDGQRIRPPR